MISLQALNFGSEIPDAVRNGPNETYLIPRALAFVEKRPEIFGPRTTVFARLRRLIDNVLHHTSPSIFLKTLDSDPGTTAPL